MNLAAITAALFQRKTRDSLETIIPSQTQHTSDPVISVAAKEDLRVNPA